MTRPPVILAFITIILSGAALAQQEQRPQEQVSPEVQHRCRQEVRKLCRKGLLPPSKAVIQRCVHENRDNLSEQCLAVFLSQQQ